MINHLWALYSTESVLGAREAAWDGGGRQHVLANEAGRLPGRHRLQPHPLHLRPARQRHGEAAPARQHPAAGVGQGGRRSGGPVRKAPAHHSVGLESKEDHTN